MPRAISGLVVLGALGIGAWRIAAADVSSAGVYTIGTVAGSDWVGDGGPAIEATLLQAEGVALDAQGNLYIADALGHRVRQVTPAGMIRTVAGTGVRGFSGDGGQAAAARLNAPYGLAVDSVGNLYICDLGNHRVRRVDVNGKITTVASGLLVAPRNVAVDKSGDLFIADFEGHRVYRLRTDGTSSVEAGSGSAGYSGDGGPAISAQLSYPAGLAVDSAGTLYIGDTQNHAVRRVSRGIITTVARVSAPTGLAIDGAGTVHVADAGGGQILRFPAAGNSDMLPMPARDIAMAWDGTIFAPDQGVVRRRQASGIVAIVAGGGSLAYGDRGDALSARLSQPSGVAFARGAVYIADRGNHRVRRVGADGVIETVAGTGEAGSSGDGGLATQAALNRPSAVSVDSVGNLYIVDGSGRVRRVAPFGQIVTVASTPAPAYAIADGSGALYISDSSLGAILKVNGGIVTTLARGLKDPRGLAVDGSGNLYFAEAGGARVGRIAPDLTITDLAPGEWKIPRGVAVDDPGNVFVADTGRQQIVRVDGSGRSTVVAGTGSPGFSGDGDAAVAAELGFPWDVAIGPEGKVFVADLDNNRIRVLTPAVAAAPSPVTQVDAVNAASMKPGAIAPGMLVAVVGAGLGAGDIPDASFLFGSLAGEFLAIDASRVLVRAPVELGTSGSIAIDVRVKGASRVVIPAVLAPSAPALFTDAAGIAGAADRGGIVSVYGTGSGVGDLPVAVSIGGAGAEVLYAGPVGNYPGVFQVNARVPDGVLGPAEVVVRFGAASSAPAMVVVR